MTNLVKICPNCQTENDLDSKFCISCGTSLEAVPVVDLGKQATYHQAVEFFTVGEFDQAIQLFEALGDFNDAPEKLQLAQKVKATQEAEMKSQQYERAISLFEQGDFVQAKSLFEQLKDYKESQEKLQLINKIQSEQQKEQQENNYQYALNLLEQNQLLEAQTIFASLGTYKESSIKLQWVQAQLEQQRLAEKQRQIESAFQLAKETQDSSQLGQAIGILQENNVPTHDLQSFMARYEELVAKETVQKQEKNVYIKSIVGAVLMVLVVGGSLFGVYKYQTNNAFEQFKVAEAARKDNKDNFYSLDKATQEEVTQFLSSYAPVNYKDYQFEVEGNDGTYQYVLYQFIGEDEKDNVLPKSGSRVTKTVVFTAKSDK